MRIVSLLPSATEIICALGLGDSLIGVTHECDFPAWVRQLPHVTRTRLPAAATSGQIDAMVREQLQSGSSLYSLDMAVLEELRPNLLVTQALCDVCAVAEADVIAAACHLPGRPRVLNLEPTTLTEVFQAILQVGDATGRQAKASELVTTLQARVDAVRRQVPAGPRPRTVVLEWLDPLFTSGHWTPELVQLAGGDEVMAAPGSRSRAMSLDELIAAAPDLLVIACCGFNVDRTLQDMPEFLARPGVSELPAVRSGAVHVIDGNAYLSRPGPRLVESLELLATFVADWHDEPVTTGPAGH